MRDLINLFRNFFGIKFNREVAALQVSKALALLAGFAGSVIFAWHLGPSQYGIYAIIFSLAGLISALVNFGVWPTTVNLLSEALGLGDREEVKNLVIYFLKVQLILTNFLWLLVIFFSHYIVGWVYKDQSFSFYLQIAAIINMLSIPFPLLTLAYQVFREINRLAAWETAKKFVSVIAGVLFVVAGIGVVGIFYGLLLSEASFFIASLIAIRWVQINHPLFPKTREIFRDFWRVSIVKYLRFGLLISVDKNLNNYVENLPGFILGVFSTPEQAGFFKVASTIGSLPQVFSSNVSRMLSSILPYKEAQTAGSIRHFYHRVAKFGTLFTAVFMGAVFVGTKLFFERLYGPAFLPALPSLYLILATNIIMGYGVGFSPVVRTLKKVGTSIGLNLIALLLTLGLGYAFIPTLGAFGAAISTLGSFAVYVIFIFMIESWLKKTNGSVGPEREKS